MKHLLVTAVLISSFNLSAQTSFEAIKDIKANSPHKGILLKAYPLTVAELENLSRNAITEEDSNELSLLMNSLDFTLLEAGNNTLILEILRKNKITIVADFIQAIFVKSEPTEITIFALAELYKKAGKIKSQKFKKLLEISSNQLFEWFVAKMDKVTPESVKDIKLLFGQLPNAGDVAGVAALLEYYGANSARTFNEFVKNKRVQELSNSDVVLPQVPLVKGIVNQPHLNGSYTLKTMCGGETRNLNQILEITQGVISNCDPGEYSKGAHAMLAPVFKSERNFNFLSAAESSLPDINQNPFTLNFVVGYKMSATGGYACENYLGRPRNCRDYSSSSIGDLKVHLKIDKCTDIYSCNLIYILDRQFENTSDVSKVSLAIDGNNKPLSIVLRDEDHSFDVSINDVVRHNSGSGKTTATNNFHFQLRRPTYSYPGMGSENATYAESLNVWAWAAILDKDPNAINDMINRLQLLKRFSSQGEAQRETEVASLYSLLLFIRDHKDSFANPVVVRALNVINQNASNRLREIREAELNKDLRSKVDIYRNRYGDNNLYLSVIENLILEEDRMQESFGEYEQIVNSLLSGQLAINTASFATKKALLISLYQAEKFEKNELLKGLKQDLSELSQFQDLPLELQILQQELM